MKLDDFMKSKITIPKIGRNQSCPCGSNKKFKKCCWIKIRNDQKKEIEESYNENQMANTD